MGKPYMGSQIDRHYYKGRQIDKDIERHDISRVDRKIQILLYQIDRL